MVVCGSADFDGIVGVSFPIGVGFFVATMRGFGRRDGAVSSDFPHGEIGIGFSGFGGETDGGETAFDVCADGPFVGPFFFSDRDLEVDWCVIFGGGGKVDGSWIGGVGVFDGGVSENRDEEFEFNSEGGGIG